MTDFYLTTDHEASSYGQPVLIVDGQAYGPADVVPRGGMMQTAAWWVSESFQHWGKDQFPLAVKFCALIGVDIGLKDERVRTDLLGEFFDGDNK